MSTATQFLLQPGSNKVYYKDQGGEVEADVRLAIYLQNNQPVVRVLIENVKFRLPAGPALESNVREPSL